MRSLLCGQLTGPPATSRRWFCLPSTLAHLTGQTDSEARAPELEAEFQRRQPAEATQQLGCRSPRQIPRHLERAGALLHSMDRAHRTRTGTGIKPTIFSLDHRGNASRWTAPDLQQSLDLVEGLTRHDCGEGILNAHQWRAILGHLAPHDGSRINLIR